MATRSLVKSGRRVLAAITIVLLLGMYLPGAAALAAISDWIPGFATFYGGQPDGMDPNNPSYGTADVRL